MSWMCPNCSSVNDDEQVECYVCGMERPKGGAAAGCDDGECVIVFSNFEALKESIKDLFRARRRRAALREAEAAAASEGAELPGDDEEALTETVEETEETSPEEDGSESAFDAPWPEHGIEFNISVIREKGYVRAERSGMNGINGYRFYRTDGTARFMRSEILVIQNMAHRI